MKKLYKYIPILAVILTAGVSCTRDAFIDDSQESSKLTLTFRTAAMDTKVTVADGEGVTGEGAENTIEHIDYFFFADDDPASEAIVSGRVLADDLVKVSDTEYEYTYDGFDTSEGAEFSDLSGESYLYVLANYPGEVSAKTMEDLLALPISSDFTKEQTSFVMDTYDKETESALIYLKPKAKDEVREIEVDLTRVAAKLVLNFRVASSITDESKDIWTPVLNEMWYNFLYGRKTATVAGEPLPFESKDDYYNTEQAAPNGGTLKDGYYEYTTEPIYVYPQSYHTSDVTAPYYKLFLPWISQMKGQNNFYYKIMLPEIKDVGGVFQRNKIYKFDVDVSVIGGTEDEWALFSDYVFVADWYSPGEIQTAVESARYLDVAVKKYEIYGLDEITVPVVSSNDIEIVSCVGKQQTVLETLDPDGPATKTPRSVTINGVTTGNYCAATGSESFKLVYKLDPNITSTTNTSFDCTPVEWTVTIRHKPTSDEPYLTKTVTVTITQYPSIYAVLREGGNSFVNGYYGLQTASVDPAPTTQNRYQNTWDNNWYYRSRSDGNIYAVADYADNTEDPNNLVDGSYGKINQVLGTNNGGAKGTTMTMITVTAFSESSNTYTVWSDGSSSGVPATGDKTEFEYIIGDPRVSWNDFWQDYPENQRNLNPYLWGGDPTTNKDWENVDRIKVTGKQKNIIAPAYMFSSDIGGRPDNNGVRFENAVKRCATYQEDGYPAGRWRLPTEAEMYFAYSLQHMDVIPHLFNGGAGYHASSGNVFDWTDNRNNSGDRTGQSFLRNNWVTQQNANNIVHSIRCVYDIWYWGEEPAVTGDDVHRYYPGTLN